MSATSSFGPTNPVYWTVLVALDRGCDLEHFLSDSGIRALINRSMVFQAFQATSADKHLHESSQQRTGATDPKPIHPASLSARSKHHRAMPPNFGISGVAEARLGGGACSKKAGGLVVSCFFGELYSLCVSFCVSLCFCSLVRSDFIL